MKELKLFPQKALLLILGLLTNLVVAAQDAALDININTDKGGGAFYTQVWFWILVGLVFILLLVALLRGGGNKG